MSFSAMPDEIVSEIITLVSLSPGNSQNNLWPLSICSRRFHNIVEPYLYSSFTESGTTTLLSFLRTILETPRFASLVKRYHGFDTRNHTTQRTLSFPCKVARIPHQEYPTDFRQLLRSAMCRGETNEDRSYLWLDDLLAGSWDAATALAVTSLPNLQKLQFSIKDRSRRNFATTPIATWFDDAFDPMAYRWINNSLRDAQGLQSSGSISKYSMGKLHTIELTLSKKHEGRVFVSDILGFLKLNSVRTLETNGIYLDLDVSLVKLVMPIQISNLSLRSCPGFSGGRRATSPMTIFGGVESLHYTVLSGQFAFSEFIDGINCMAPSLRQLFIGTSNVYDQSRSNKPDSAPSMFVALENIDMAAPFLTRWLDMGATVAGKYTDNRVLWNVEMPKTLKILTIRRCDQIAVINVRDLVTRNRDCCKLKVLHLEFIYDFPRENAENEVNILREECVVAGVTFTADWDGGNTIRHAQG